MQCLSLFYIFTQSQKIENLNIRLEERPVLGDKNLFQMKEECAKYRNDIDIQLEKNAFEYAQTNFNSTQSFIELFYSPKVNSCLYVLSEVGYRDGAILFEQPKLVDALSGEVLQTGFREPESPTYHQDLIKFNSYVDTFR